MRIACKCCAHPFRLAGPAALPYLRERPPLEFTRPAPKPKRRWLRLVPREDA